MALIDKIKKKAPSPSDNNVVPTDGNTSPTIVGTTPAGKIVVAQNVDWKVKGIQEAGAAQADLNSFHAGIQSAFAQTRKSQELDSQLQEKMKAQLEQEIEGLKGDKSVIETQLQAEQDKLNDIESHIRAKTDEKNRILTGKTGDEKTNTVNLWIGTFLITLLTIYLFIFYSSTAYSAFFRDWSIYLAGMAQTGTLTVTEKIFDGKAVFSAFNDEGVFAGFFVLFMPIVFMALGYVAHHTGRNSKGFSKYSKVTLMYLMTFAFDFLLAYNIAKHAYDAGAIFEEGDPQAYNVAMAIVDSNFWMVIFCGFVAYVIWGLLYGFVMNCYDKKKDNTLLLRCIEEELNKLKESKTAQQKVINDLKVEINKLVAKIAQKEKEFRSSVRYDFDVIHKNLADYYQGWVSFFGIQGLNTDGLALAYNEEKRPVNDWMDGIKNRYKQNQEDKQ